MDALIMVSSNRRMRFCFHIFSCKHSKLKSEYRLNELSRNHCLYVFQKRRLVPNIRVTFKRNKDCLLQRVALSRLDFFCMRSVVCQNRKRVIDSFIVAWLSKINLARSVYTIYSSSFEINGLKMNNIYVLDKLYMGRAIHK